MNLCPLLRSLSPRIELCDAPFKARRHSRDKGLLDWYYAFSCLGWTYWSLCCLINDWQSTESCSFLMETNFGPLSTIFLYWSGKIVAFDTINQESLGIWWLLTWKQELNHKNDGFLRIDYCWCAMTVEVNSAPLQVRKPSADSPWKSNLLPYNKWRTFKAGGEFEVKFCLYVSTWGPPFGWKVESNAGWCRSLSFAKLNSFLFFQFRSGEFVQ